MGLLITAGVLVYALMLIFVYSICRAASTIDQFYTRIMDLERTNAPHKDGALETELFGSTACRDQ